jgi:hypothetical protein
MHATKNNIIGNYVKYESNDIFLVTCINFLLVKYMVKIWHKGDQPTKMDVVLTFCTNFVIYVRCLTQPTELLVLHACPVRKFKTRSWNTYSKPVPFTSHPTRSFWPAGQRALARHVVSLTCGTACEETDDAPNWLTPPLTMREKPRPSVFNRHFYLSIVPRCRTKCYNLYSVGFFLVCI